LGEGLYAGGYIHGVAQNVRATFDHIANVDSDAQLYFFRRCVYLDFGREFSVEWQRRTEPLATRSQTLRGRHLQSSLLRGRRTVVEHLELGGYSLPTIEERALRLFARTK
jgi:hypothetical protein